MWSRVYQCLFFGTIRIRDANLMRRGIDPSSMEDQVAAVEERGRQLMEQYKEGLKGEGGERGKDRVMVSRHQGADSHAILVDDRGKLVITGAMQGQPGSPVQVARDGGEQRLSAGGPRPGGLGHGAPGQVGQGCRRGRRRARGSTIKRGSRRGETTSSGRRGSGGRRAETSTGSQQLRQAFHGGWGGAFISFSSFLH